MKYIFLLFFYIKYLLSQEGENCGYSGSKGNEIEQELDDCFDKNVKDSRVRMSIGFELCFGFNYSKLNSTVSEPIESIQNSTNTDLIDLSIKTCRYAEESSRPRRDGGEIDYEQEKKYIDNCKKFFDISIEAMYNEQATITSFMDENENLLKDILPDDSDKDSLKRQIENMIQPIDECKEPELIFRTKLIRKYLEMYLHKIASPELPSFNWENLDVLLHPEIYMLKNDKFTVPDFEHFKITSNKIRANKGILLPKKREIVLKERNPEIQKKIEELENGEDQSIWERFKNWATDEKEELEKQKKLEDLKMKENWGTEPWEVIKERDKNKKIEEVEKIKEEDSDMINIEDFWNSNIKIKKKRFNNEDFNRYRIKNWDVDQKIKKMFGKDSFI